MSAVAEKVTLDELRAEAQRLGVTEEFTGGALEELLSVARDNDDPMGYLAIHAPPEAADDLESAEPIGDVPAPFPLRQSVVSISVPLAASALDGCYISTHVEVRMSQEQGLTLRRLHLALDARGARLANGRRVVHAADAVKWLLERVGGVGD